MLVLLDCTAPTRDAGETDKRAAETDKRVAKTNERAAETDERAGETGERAAETDERAAEAQTDAKPLIHEEVTASDVTPPRRTEPPLMVLDLGDARYVLLGDAELEWTDREQPAGRLDNVTVTKPIVRERVSKSMLDWIGTEVEVAGEGTARCKTTIAALEVVGRVLPSYYFYDDLQRIYEAGGEPSKERMAAAMWSMIQSDLLTLGKLADCSGEIAVRLDATADERVTTFAMQELDSELAASARKAFVALTDYRQQQQDFVEHHDRYIDDEPPGGKPGPWDAGGVLVEQLWTAGAERFVFRSVGVGGGCEEYTARLWALWRVGDGDALEFVASGSDFERFWEPAPLRPMRVLRWHDSLWLLTKNKLFEVRAKDRDASLIWSVEPADLESSC